MGWVEAPEPVALSTNALSLLSRQPGRRELRAGVPAHHVPQPGAPTVRDLPCRLRYVLRPAASPHKPPNLRASGGNAHRTHPEPRQSVSGGKQSQLSSTSWDYIYIREDFREVLHFY